jgi:hypothetical protein
MDLLHSVPPEILNPMMELFWSHLRHELDIMVDLAGEDGPDWTSIVTISTYWKTSDGSPSSSLEKGLQNEVGVL